MVLDSMLAQRPGRSVPIARFFHLAGVYHMEMEWAKLLVAIFIPVVSWALVYYSTKRRDDKNKLRDERIQYLTEAFRLLAKAPWHPRIHEIGAELNTAVAIIQFYGTERQVDLIQQFVKEFAATRKAALDPLLDDLRRELRRELGLSQMEKTWWWLQVTPAGTQRSR